ncbi:MAG TPA: F0F1 ATP synthase subunit gamma [Trueperaceae bacterium]|nr:F0F1 ATP synthase subunit gamma [Trueperaceae bacterium]
MTGGGQVRRRLESAESLGGVVSTMKSLASVRVHQYRRTMRALDASTLTLDRAARAILYLHPELAEPEPPERYAKTAAVVFGSDRGLCGPFNDRMARYAVGELTSGRAGEVGGVVAIGRRLAGRMRAAGVEPGELLSAPSSLDNVDVAVARLLDLIDEWRHTGRAGRIWLIYARPAGATSFMPRNVQVLPIDPVWLRYLRDRPWPSKRVPMEFSEPRSLVQGVIRQRMALAFVKAFGSSLAAENASRLAAMEAASRNIDERLERLRTAYHSARQTAVTEELLDIQAAAEALRRE